MRSHVQVRRERRGPQGTSSTAANVGARAARFGGLALAGALLGACGGEPEPVWQQPDTHLLLVVLDAFHAGHVTHLGYEREVTPNLDALAAQGWSYANTFAPAPYTLAGIPSLLTGRWPDRHGLVRKDFALHSSEQTLAEQLSERGYATLGAVGNDNGSEIYGLDAGFDRFENLMVVTEERPANVFEPDGKGGFNSLHIPRAEEYPPILEGWLEDGAFAGQPTFGYLHVLEPHSPYRPPARFLEAFGPVDYDGLFAAGDTEAFVATLGGDVEVSEADVAAARALYDANIAYADWAVGEFVALFEQAGVWDEVAMVVTSDHGEAFWQHGQWGHNTQLFDESLQVPLIVRLPGAPNPGTVIETLASTVDVVPSLGRWLALGEWPLPLDGMYLDTLPEDGRAIYLRSNRPIPDLGVRTASDKVIVGQDSDAGTLSAIQYYDLLADPAEQSNAVERAPADVVERSSDLRAWYGERLNELTSRKREAGVKLTPAQRQMLSVLGYGE
ncbi:MAG: sulfatase [Planctomycetota bacterium]|jgi:arylsulfatase